MTGIRDQGSGIRARARAVFASALLVGSLIGAPAWGQQQWRPAPPGGPAPSKAAIEEARERYKKGIKLYEEEGAVEAALIELQRAYDLAPRFAVLYNIGLVARSNRDYVVALRAFERYLADGGNQVPLARRNEVEKEIDAIKSFVAKVDVQVSVEGAAVAVDDLGIGKSPLAEPALVNAGRRKITASKDGQTASKVVSVAGGDNIKVELDLSEPKAAGVAPVPAPAQSQSGATQSSSAAQSSPPPGGTSTQGPDTTVTPATGRSYAWIGFVAAGALAVGAGITGGLALSAQGDLDDTRYTGSQPPPDVEDQQSKVDTLALVTDVLAGAAVVALGVTIVLIATDSGSSATTGKAAAAGSAPPPKLVLRAAPRGASLVGSF